LLLLYILRNFPKRNSALFQDYFRTKFQGLTSSGAGVILTSKVSIAAKLVLLTVEIKKYNDKLVVGA
jgi:hypothetical protein